MPKVVIQPYDPATPAVKIYQAQNSDWRRKTRLIARVDDGNTAVRVWFGITPDVSPGGTNVATDGIYVDPGQSFNDELQMGDVWYAVVATAAAATAVYLETPGSQNPASISTT